ncbi:NusA-like transcription termination signal-binding factor [Candidatus Woesearchaeota archaeon]|nr:NusA-like transcription termination signal-binding factor [Candidatus Woesearchaeota archaeon]
MIKDKTSIKKLVYDSDMIRVMSMFESITKARLKDFFILDEILYFVIAPGDMGKALGKNKVNVYKLREKLDRKISIIEYNEDIIRFVSNIIYPFRADDIKKENTKIIIYGKDLKNKAKIIGKRASTLRRYEKVVQRYFPEIEEIMVK